jgi:hypothetical protein
MKYALIIGNNKYDDQKLAQLKTPAADSQALAKILDDKTIGSFDEVTPLINQTETRVRRAISTFLTNKKPDDLVLLYFSGHGILDDRGRLYLALKDTQVNLLKATSIPSSFVADEMDSCRSKRQILILDCCHSGAFARGTKGEQKAITETTFEGSGFGRVVLTASDSTQYALEGDQVIKQTELSLFTHFLLEGLKTGEADVNNDGLIALDEWYDYTYTRVIAETPRQVPHKWSYNQQGDLIIAKNPYVKKRVVELPYELLQALESSFVGIRESAVNELGKYLQSRDAELVGVAVAALEKMKQDDSRRISLLAERLLVEFSQTHPQTSKVTPSPATVLETAKATRAEAVTSKIVPEVSTPSVPNSPISQPKINGSAIAVERSAISQKFIFNPAFWSKWIGIAILGLILLAILYDFNTFLTLGDYIPNSYFMVILFGVMAGGLSLLQWFLFRDRLKEWWIAGNAAAGIFFGLLHRSLLLGDTGWTQENLRILLAVWLIGNFALGLILMRRTQAGSSLDFFSPGQRATQPVETKAQPKSEVPVLDLLFWFKWMALAVLGIILSILLYNYSLTVIAWFFAVPFGLVTGLTSLAQWWVFRDRLESWWISANVAAGALLGALYFADHTSDSWGGNGNFWLYSTLWIIGNFIVGTILLWSTQKRSKDIASKRSASSVTEWMQSDPRQTSFVTPLAVSLLLFALVAFLNISRDSSFLSIPDWLFNVFAITAVMASLWLGIALLRKKDVRMNFGLLTLAIFAVLNGIVLALITINPNFSTPFLTVPGIMSLVAGIFLVFQAETWKHLRTITLAGFLILIFPTYFGMDEMLGTHTFSIITLGCALLSGIFFFPRK